MEANMEQVKKTPKGTIIGYTESETKEKKKKETKKE